MLDNQAASKRFIHWMIIAVVIVVLDQATKWAIIEWVPLYGRVPINDVLNLTHQRNYGAAWSILADAGGWQRWFFITLATVVSIVLVVWSWKERRMGSTMLIAGLAMVLGGAVGNLVDRVVLGYVTDFIQVWFGSWAFPSFNVADTGITIGAGLLILDSFLAKPDEESKPEEDTPAP